MSESVKAILSPRQSDIGNLVVRRVLPQRAARFFGPFIFFDHMGPATFAPGAGLDVKPHPHIGLATLTYLYEGAITHRDSLGFVQDILPAISTG
jgi:redox-sensitive bicupin YhaK (pirin superfamily)